MKNDAADRMPVAIMFDEITTRNQQSVNRLGLWLTSHSVPSKWLCPREHCHLVLREQFVCCARLDRRCDVRNGIGNRHLLAVDDEAMTTVDRSR